MPWQIGLFNNIATFPHGNPSRQHLSIIWEKITAPGISFALKKTELRFSCSDKKSRSSSKIHNQICGSVIAASRCHISICPESGKEWSNLSRGSHCVGRINIDQPSDTECSWDFEAPWLCCWHLSHPQSTVLVLSPCEDAGFLSYHNPVLWIPLNLPHSSKDVCSPDRPKIRACQKLTWVSAMFFLPAVVTLYWRKIGKAK